jgi:hypothetical protein
MMPLKAHEPYPAFAVDRHWMMVASNEGFRPFIADSVLSALLEELRGYPLPAGVVPSDSAEVNPIERFAIPFQLQTDYGAVSFFSTTTTFGTPLEITLSEFSLECFYPVDAASAAILHRASGKLPLR